MNGPGGTFPRVRPADPSGPMAASTDGGRVVPFTGARTASSVTPNSRPAPAAPVLGKITGATAVSTDPSVELSAPAPGGALGSVYSLARPAAGRQVAASGRARQDPRPPGRSSNLTFGAE